MKSQARTIALALLVFSSACSQTPTGPSQLSPRTVIGDASASIFGLTDSQAARLVVDWSTLTQSPGAALPLTLGEDPPVAPSNLAFVVSGTTVTLTWSPPGPGPTTASYVLQAGTGPGLSNIVNFNTGSTAVTFTATSVPSGTYYVRVRAINSDGASSPSNEVVVSVGGGPCAGVPSAPSGLTASVSGSSLSLSWTAPASGCAPTGYVIEAGSAPGSSNLANVNTGSTATTFAASSVPGGTYYVRVRAANGAGVGDPSNEATVIVGGTSPPIPVNGRWVGVAPDGIIIVEDPYDNCPAEYDLQLDLTTSGTAVTGTATTRLRRVEAAGDCSNVLGEVATYGVINGTVGSGTISFALGSGTFRFSGTFTATRMTGTVFVRESTRFSQTGSFALTRQ